jgi:hypothetical protein
LEASPYGEATIFACDAVRRDDDRDTGPRWHDPEFRLGCNVDVANLRFRELSFHVSDTASACQGLAGACAA